MAFIVMKNDKWICRLQNSFSKAASTHPFAPEDFTEKPVLKLVERFSGHCPAVKS